jgi:hypothetical protein
VHWIPGPTAIAMQLSTGENFRTRREGALLYGKRFLNSVKLGEMPLQTNFLAPTARPNRFPHTAERRVFGASEPRAFAGGKPTWTALALPVANEFIAFQCGGYLIRGKIPLGGWAEPFRAHHFSHAA